MGTIVPAISGPKRPQDYVALTDAKSAFASEMENTFKRPMGKEVAVDGEDYTMESGKVVIASITSCTNTSNPYVMIGAGLVARKAAALGLNRKPWVKTSLAPGSRLSPPISKPPICRTTSTRSASTLWATAAPPASATPARSSPNSPKRSPKATWSPPRSCRATATSRAASRPTCAPTIWHHRRLWWPMRWPARWTSTCAQTHWQDQDGNDVYLKDIWPTPEKIAELVEADRDPRSLPVEIRRRLQRRREMAGC